MRWIGHCGLAATRPGGAPDRATLDAALALGLDRLEVDVCATADGAVVLHHDAALPDGTPLAAVDLQTARRSADLLTLDEAVDHLGGRLPLLLDLKGAAVVEPLGAWLAARRDATGLAMCTDDAAALRRLGELAPAVARWRTLPALPAGPGEGRRRILAAVTRQRLVAQLPDLAAQVGAAGLCVDQWAVSRSLCAQAHRLGLEVAAWTVNSAPLARAMRRAGVDLLTTDRPAAMRRALGDPAPATGAA